MRAFLILTTLVLVLPGRLLLAAPSADAFGTLPMVFDAAISPDGKQIAIIMNIQGEYGIRVVTLGKQGEALRAIRLGEGVKPSWIRWANDERVLAGLWESRKLRTTPYTVSFIFTLDASTMKGKVLVENDKILRQNNAYVIDFLEQDPDHILMGFSDANQALVDINRVNVETGRYRRIERSKPNVQRWYTDASGEPRVGQGLNARAGSDDEQVNLIIRDSEEDKWRSAEEYPGLDPGAKIFGFTDDPDELVVGDYAGRDTLGLYIYDLRNKALSEKLFHHDTYDASGLVVDGSGSVVGARFVADTNKVALFEQHDTVLGRMRSQYSDYTVDYVDQSGDGRQILFKISNAYSPGVLGFFDAKTGETKMLANYRPELPADDMGAVAEVSYAARDGFELSAYVTLPPEVTGSTEIANLPFIVLPHGGPYARDSKQFDEFAQFFATRGFGVLQMNFRGSAGYGKSYQEAGRRNWVVMQEDVEDGTRWLIRNGLADPERICVAGWSYGGYAALIGAIKTPDLYACAISIAGVTDLKDMINDIRKYRFGSILAENFILRGFEDRDAIAENSPVKRASELQVPLFLAHGKADETVHFDQFSRMRRALRKSTVPVTYMAFDDEDHYFSNQKNRQSLYRGLEKFLVEFK